MNMVHHLVITENKLYAHLHTMKVYNTRLVLTPPRLPHQPYQSFAHKDPSFFEDWSVYLLQSIQSFQVIELVEWPIFCINLSKAFFTKNAWPSERILYVLSHMPCIAVGCQSCHDAYPQFSRSLLETPGTNWFPFNVHKRMFKGAVSWQSSLFCLILPILALNRYGT